MSNVGFLPKARNDIGPKEWRYVFAVEKSGVILRTAKLFVYGSAGKALLVARQSYIEDQMSPDVIETKLVRRFFRYIGAM